MNKKVSVSMTLTLIILAMTVTFSITMIAAMRLFDQTVSSVSEKENMYAKISELDRYVRANAYYPIDEDALYDTMSAGYMLGISDASARYYTASAYTEWQQLQNGTLMGIGCDVVKDNATGFALVTRVYAGSPAADLGLATGSYIEMIDDVEVKSLSTTESILSRLRGESGTTVTLTYLTSSLEENTETITRRSYTVSTVFYQQIKTFGYIKITDFADNTDSELSYALNLLQQGGVTSFVIDLRDNASRNWLRMAQCVNLLCAEGTVGYLVDRNGVETPLLECTALDSVSLPVTCLVNGGTSGAAELFAETVRANNGGSVVGTATAGHGTQQSDPYKMSDGSALVVTVAQVLTGERASFDGTGIEIDAVYELTADEQLLYYTFTPETDPQVQRAMGVSANAAGETVEGTITDESASAVQPAAGASAGQEADPDGEAASGAPSDSEAQSATAEQ